MCFAVEIHGKQHAAAGVRGAEGVKRVGTEIVAAHVQFRELRAAVERGKVGKSLIAQIKRRGTDRDQLLPEPDVPAGNIKPRCRGKQHKRCGADCQNAGEPFLFVGFVFLHREPPVFVVRRVRRLIAPVFFVCCGKLFLRQTLRVIADGVHIIHMKGIAHIVIIVVQPPCPAG